MRYKTLSRIVEEIEEPNSTQIKGLSPYEEMIYNAIRDMYYENGRPLLNISDPNILEDMADMMENDIIMDNLDEIGNCCFKFLAMGLIKAKPVAVNNKQTEIYISFPHNM